MKRLAILGASGHGKVVGDAASLCGWDGITFFDDAWPRIETLGPWRVMGSAADLGRGAVSFDGVVVAIGHNATRLEHQRALQRQGLPIVTIVHPAATVSRWAAVGPGSVICAGAVVNAVAMIGAACIVNTCASVDHDCVLADGVHLSPGVHLGGDVRVGERSWVGIAASVNHGLSIGAGVTIGAGAAVVEDVRDGVTVVGIPAREVGHRSRV